MPQSTFIVATDKSCAVEMARENPSCLRITAVQNGTSEYVQQTSPKEENKEKEEKKNKTTMQFTPSVRSKS